MSRETSCRGCCIKKWPVACLSGQKSSRKEWNNTSIDQSERRPRSDTFNKWRGTTASRAVLTSPGILQPIKSPTLSTATLVQRNKTNMLYLKCRTKSLPQNNLADEIIRKFTAQTESIKPYLLLNHKNRNSLSCLVCLRETIVEIAHTFSPLLRSHQRLFHLIHWTNLWK